MRERPEPDLVSNFANAQIPIQQSVFRRLNPRARKELRECQARGLAELSAKIEYANVHGARNASE